MGEKMVLSRKMLISAKDSFTFDDQAADA